MSTVNEVEGSTRTSSGRLVPAAKDKSARRDASTSREPSSTRLGPRGRTSEDTWAGPVDALPRTAPTAQKACRPKPSGMCPFCHRKKPGRHGRRGRSRKPGRRGRRGRSRRAAQRHAGQRRGCVDNLFEGRNKTCGYRK